MGAKHALKKLKKNVSKAPSKSLKQLQALPLARAEEEQQNNPRSSYWKSEFKQISQQTLVNVASELAAPFNPVLSWFDGGETASVIRPSAKSADIKKDANMRPSVKSIVHLPFKSPPCKRCPALSHGVCKCAAKKLKMSA
ncbi:hypothetical protein L4C38_08250 [Vibrio kasasachensis]|uniref:hypothetical protein n=1 Tax=Vibrio kasasachensis TaxID=2910248 RepID=UPI003D0F05D9